MFISCNLNTGIKVLEMYILSYRIPKEEYGILYTNCASVIMNDKELIRMYFPVPLLTTYSLRPSFNAPLMTSHVGYICI